MRAVFKKAVVLVMSFCMLAQSVLCANAKNADDFMAEPVFEKEMSLLSTLGITSHISQNKGTEGISRIDFLQMVMKTVGISPSPKGEKLFYDVDPDTEGGAYIAAAYELNIISGIGAGLFGAESGVTYDEAISMILKAMHYEAVADEKGGYPSGYRVLATQLELMDGEKYDAYLNIKDACCMIFRAMCAPMYDTTVHNSSENTLLKQYYHIKRADGIVMQNRYAKLPAGDGLAADKVLVGNETYLVGETEIEDYIGHDVEIYFAEESGVHKILYFEPTGNDVSITVTAKDVKTLMPGKFVLQDDSGKQKTYRLSGTSVTIENNKVIKLIESYQIPDSAFFEFIDNNNDGVYDVVKIEKHEMYKVSAVDLEKETIYSDEGTSKKIELSKYDGYQCYDADDRKIELGDISANDVLAVVRNSGSNHIKLIRCMVTEAETVLVLYEGENEKSITTENGNCYIISDALAKIQPQRTVSVGERYIFVLNPLGEITYIKENVRSSELMYGYLMKWACVEKTLSGSYMRLKILTEDSKVEEYVTGEKIIFGGENKVPVETLAEALKKPQMIRYHLDEDGVVDKVEFAAQEGNEGFRIVGKAGTGYDSRYYTTTQTVGGRVLVDANTKIFTVSDDVETETKFSVATSGKVLVKAVNYPNAIGYSSVADSLVAEVAVIYRENTLVMSPDSAIFVFDQYVSIYQAESGEKSRGVAGYYEGKYTEFILNEEIAELEYAIGADTFAVKKGDVMKLVVDDNKEIVKYECLFAANSKKVLQSNTPSSKGFSYETRYDYGSLSEKYDRYFRICLDDTTDEYDAIYVPVNETYIYVYDSNEAPERQIRTIGYDELGVYAENAKMFISLYYSQPRGIVIYK